MRKVIARVRAFRPLAWTQTFPWKQWLFVGLPVALGLLLTVWIAARYLKPAPPQRVVLATGPAGSAYQVFGERYAKVFAREGVTLDLVATKGARDNYKRLRDLPEEDDLAPVSSASASREAQPPGAAPHIDAGFVRGGIGKVEEAPRLVSLGTVAYEALWVFCQGKRTFDDLPDLRGKTVAVGASGAGQRRLVRTLLAANGLEKDDFTALEVGGAEAGEALLSGKADCIFLLEPPEAGILKALLYAPKAQIVDFGRRAEAYTKKMPFLQRVTLPEGAIDLAQNLPGRPVTLLAAQTQIVAREDLHPAIQMLLMQAAKEVHGAVGLFNRDGELPVANRFDFPLSAEAQRFYERGRPFLQRYLPFWLANLADRLVVLLIPVVAIVFPLVRLLPPLYAWNVRRRIYRWYGELMYIENEMRRELSHGETRDFGERLDWIEREVNALHPPLAFASFLYSLREHIDFVQHRLEQIAEAARATPAAGPQAS
ncbi:MAG: ABC transporter substrate-binding protein [Rhodocyclaceae bacterium]|nr:ABC transporter substrate-binding protein [Rhodocyclaceae bacterium]MCA3146131.1 ABC transporter substrate-binding protein [Rhodocyclaceae bacterium]